MAKRKVAGFTIGFKHVYIWMQFILARGRIGAAA
jgi:hypothetical protein